MSSVGSEKFYVIGFAIQSMKDQTAVVSHEIFHAYYHLNSAYRACVKDFWQNEISSDDRSAITREIGKAYNTSAEDLVIDEFQAYLIQNGADQDRLKAFVSKYQSRLLKKLRRRELPSFASSHLASTRTYRS